MGIQYTSEEHPSDRAMRELREQQAVLAPGELKELASHAPTLLPPKEYANDVNPLGGPGVQINTSDPSKGTRRFVSSQQDAGVPVELVRAHTAMGQSVSSWAEVNEATMLYVNGMQVQAGAASKLGLCSRHPDGSFGPPGAPSAEQTAQDAEAKAAAAEANAPIDGTSSELKQVLGKLGELAGSEQKANATLASVVAKGIDGDFGAAGQVLTRQLGIDPSQGAENVRAAVENGTATVAAKLDTMGVDGKAVIEHVASTMPAGERANLALGLLRGDRESWNRMMVIGRKLQRHAA